MKNRILFVQLVPERHEFIYMYTGLKEYRRVLLKKYPNMEKWFPKEIFDLKPIWTEKPYNSVYGSEINTSCLFIANNLDTPSTVMSGCGTQERILSELKKARENSFPYTHVGFSIYVPSYSKFVECAHAVKNFDNKIITIAGNVGCLFKQTKNYVDYICRGDGVPFLRNLLGEDVNKPYCLKLISYRNKIELLGRKIRSPMVNIITKVGCPMKCDFCATNQLFEGKFTKPLFTPQEVHDSLVKHREKIKKDFITLFCEPTAITNKKWWYELFELFVEEPYDFPIAMLTTISSMNRFDLDRISNSSMRFELLNVGVESFSMDYGKTQRHKETKKLFKKLSDYGIGANPSFIIGFDHHTRENVWEEIYQLINLEAIAYSIFNLHPLPYTPIWYQLEKEKRLLNIPNDFYYLTGFVPYKHPHFKSGFEDMLPLLRDINEFICREVGDSTFSLMKLYENAPKQRECISNKIKVYKYISKELFPSWKAQLDPSKKQLSKYLA